VAGVASTSSARAALSDADEKDSRQLWRSQATIETEPSARVSLASLEDGDSARHLGLEAIDAPAELDDLLAEGCLMQFVDVLDGPARGDRFKSKHLFYYSASRCACARPC